MDVMKELVYYCEQDNPVGALLLTGEWGCGKTYLLDNDLKGYFPERLILDWEDTFIRKRFVVYRLR